MAHHPLEIDNLRRWRGLRCLVRGAAKRVRPPAQRRVSILEKNWVVIDFCIIARISLSIMFLWSNTNKHLGQVSALPKQKVSYMLCANAWIYIYIYICAREETTVWDWNNHWIRVTSFCTETIEQMSTTNGKKQQWLPFWTNFKKYNQNRLISTKIYYLISADT